MNIYITKDDSKKIENFTNIKLQTFQKEVNEIINNSCENIVVDDIIDFVSHESIPILISALVQKLRTGGKIFITGIELGVLCRHTVSEIVSEQDYSSVISPRASLSCVDSIVNLLKDKKLNIETSTIKGLRYEITATR